MNTTHTVYFDNLIEVSNGSASFGAKVNYAKPFSSPNAAGQIAQQEIDAIKVRAQNFAMRFKAAMPVTK